MTYISGTLTSANPAADLYTTINTALSSAGFTFVESVIISTRTHAIWKSPAASNVMNLDWYLDVTYTTSGAGNIWFSPFEDYNSTTHLGFRGPYAQSDNTIETTYYSRFGATGYALETNWYTASTTNNQIGLSTANFGYWISITTDRVIAMTSINVTKVVYTGFFEANSEHIARADTALFPLFTGTVTPDGGMNLGMVTRAPKGSSTSIYWMYTARTYSYSNIATIPEGGYGALGDNSVNPFAGYTAPRGRTVYVIFGYYANGITTVGTNSTSSAVVGKLRDTYMFSAASTVSRGDTVTISGQAWVVCSATSNYSFGFKAV